MKIKMKYQIFFLGLTIICMSNLSSCSTTPTGRSQLVFMPESQMAQMGAQSFSQMKSKQKLSQSKKEIERINCISKRIIENMDSDNDFSKWEVKVFEDKAINAFALPGKKIGVYTGLIAAAENDAQIASVIGHEVGHVLARHGNERVSQTLIIQGGLLAADIFLDSGNSAKNQMILASLGLGAQFGVLLPFSRKHESEADHIGLNLMAKAGFNPQESVNFWKVMKKTSSNEVPELLSTHPANDTRIKDLNANMLKAKKIYLQNIERYPTCPK